MIITTNSIPLQYQDHILATVDHRSFPWYSVQEIFQGKVRTTFSHLILNDGPDGLQGSTATEYYNMFLPLAFAMSDLVGKPIKKLLRIRLGLILPTKWTDTDSTVSYQQSGEDPHLDFFIPHYTGLYYINNSDGDTIIYNEKTKSDNYTEAARVAPEKGKISIFDGECYHSSGTPIRSSHRLVATINFTV